MSSWSYAYFFPGKNDKLDFSPSSDLLFQPEFTSDSLVITMKEDEEGHCVEDGAENWNNESANQQIVKKKTGAYQLTYKNQTFFFNVIFANCGNNPYISIAWQNNVFMRLDEIAKLAFFEKIRLFAATVNASYIIFLKDAPGFFEDKFFFIEDAPVIDNTLSSGFNFRIDTIWIKDDKPMVVLHSSGLQFIKQNESGYREFACV